MVLPPVLHQSLADPFALQSHLFCFLQRLTVFLSNQSSQALQSIYVNPGGDLV